MNAMIIRAFILAILASFLLVPIGHADGRVDTVVINAVLFDDDDARQNRKAIRQLKRILRRDGEVFVWVTLTPPAIGFDVRMEELSAEGQSHQNELLKAALDSVLSGLHMDEDIQRAPTYYQRGVSELVKIRKARAFRRLMNHHLVQQLTLHQT